jgi:hypothetical protein
MQTIALRSYSLRSSILLLCAFVATALLLLPLQVNAAQRTVAANFIPSGEITVDGDISEWPASAKVIDESGEADLTHRLWCWSGSAWTSIDAESDCVNSYLYNDEGQIDIQTAYFGMNATNMYLAFTTHAPMMGVTHTGTGAMSSFFLLPNVADIDTLPIDFDHEMVFAFGSSKENDFDHYLVADLFVDKDLTQTQMSSGPQLKVYKESGTTTGFQEDEDKLLGTMSATDSEPSSDDSGSASTTFEVRQNVEKLFELTGMDYKKYGFRLETHSNSGDTTDRVVINMASAKKPGKTKHTSLGLTYSAKGTPKFNWPDVSGATKYKVKLQKQKGSKWVTVSTKTNVKKSKYNHLQSVFKENTTYRYAIQSCNTVGCSAWSPYKSFKVGDLE